MLKDRKIHCLKACPCIFQPGNVTGWAVKGLSFLCMCKLMFRTDALSKQTDNDIQTNNERNGITYVQSFTSMNQVVEGLLSGF